MAHFTQPRDCFLQSQNRVSGLSTGSPHFLHPFLLVEPISIPISGLLITKIEFVTQILTQQPTTVSGHSRLSQKSPKFLQFPSHVLGRIKRPIPGLFPYQTCLLNTKFPHKQHPTFWTVPALKNISNKFK